jgi:hypothetical protein
MDFHAVNSVQLKIPFEILVQHTFSNLQDDENILITFVISAIWKITAQVEASLSKTFRNFFITPSFMCSGGRSTYSKFNNG